MLKDIGGFGEAYPSFTAERELDKPKWWNSHGFKLRVIEVGEDFVKIGSPNPGVVDLLIRKGKVPKEAEVVFFVDYSIRYAKYESVSASHIMQREVLMAAFGLAGSTGWPDEQYMIRDYGITTGNVGRFVRYKDYLNIPAIGTGYDGNPNLSIFLSEQIKEAVRKLISS